MKVKVKVAGRNDCVQSETTKSLQIVRSSQFTEKIAKRLDLLQFDRDVNESLILRYFKNSINRRRISLKVM